MPTSNAPRVSDDDRHVVQRSLAPEAHAAVVALARALAAVNNEVARRSAFRSALIDRCMANSGLPAHDRSSAVVSGLLADLAELVAPRSGSDVEAAAFIDELPGLQGAAKAIRHRSERWDGSGPGGLRAAEIPFTARLLAGAELLIGPDIDAALKSWPSRLLLLDSAAGRALDPDVVELLRLELPHAPIGLIEVGIDAQLNNLSHRVAGPSAKPAEALDTIGAAISAVDSIDDLLSLFVEQTRSALDATMVSVVRIDSADTSTTSASVGDIELSATTIDYHDFAHRPEFADLWHKRGVLHSDGVSIRSEAAWPLYVDGRLWGALWAATSNTALRSLDANDLATLRAVAGYIEIAVAQARRLAEFQHLAMRDPLTGLGNRRVLEEKLDQVFRRPPEARGDVALIMCDVDGLKRVNDLEGHAAGDQLLIEAGKALSAAAATTSNYTVCRIGGDEFCIILDGGGMLSAHPVAEMACDLFEKSGSGRSLSHGVALATADVDDPRTLMRRADEAQYEHKRLRKGLPVADLVEEDADRRKLRPHI